MKRTAKYICFFAFVSLFFLFFTCKREEKITAIELPPTPVLSAQSSWGVVTSAHLRLREEPTINSKVITTLWKGYVVEIFSKRTHTETIEGKTGHWYQVVFQGLNGWVFGAYIDLYSSKERAEKAAAELK